jgi:peptidoglycan/xylan/chitin deacetylase (PgdA/CDA1 family)
MKSPLFLALLALLLTSCGTAAPKQQTQTKAVPTRPHPVQISQPLVKHADSRSLPQSQFSLQQIKENQKVKIPVLMYHCVAEKKKNSLFVPPSLFEKQISSLAKEGFSFLSATDLYDAWEKGYPLPKRPVVITFDDGYEDNYQNAFPILEKFGAKATIFVVTGQVGKKGYLNWKQIKEMDRNGIDIESHTVHHPDLRKSTAHQLKKELQLSKQVLESELRRPVIIFSYPYGKYNAEVIQETKKTGYRMAFSTKPGFSSHAHGVFALHRVRVSPDQPLPSFISKLKQAAKGT